jgi:hypothetical protein
MQYCHISVADENSPALTASSRWRAPRSITPGCEWPPGGCWAEPCRSAGRGQPAPCQWCLPAEAATQPPEQQQQLVKYGNQCGDHTNSGKQCSDAGRGGRRARDGGWGGVYVCVQEEPGIQGHCDRRYWFNSVLCPHCSGASLMCTTQHTLLNQTHVALALALDHLNT